MKKTFWDKLMSDPKATLNPKVVRALKNLQTSHNEDIKKIVEQAAKEKAKQKNLKF